MDELTNSLIFGVLWWDSYCLINLVGGHYALPVTEEAFNYYNWHNHMANILTLRENLIDTLNAQLDREVYVIEKTTPVTQNEVEEILRLEKRRADLESSIIEEQKADIAEQKTKLINQIVYPTAIVVGLKLAWSLGCWLLPKAVAVVA
jgi:hypothetical protein